VSELELFGGRVEEVVSGIVSVRSRPGMGGVSVEIVFANGYGASIVNHFGTYGTELAVLDRYLHLTYATPVTDDVIGWLDRGTLIATLRLISALPEAPYTGNTREIEEGN